MAGLARVPDCFDAVSSVLTGIAVDVVVVGSVPAVASTEVLSTVMRPSAASAVMRQLQ